MGTSGAETGGISSVSAADTTIIAAGSSAVTLKANVGTGAGSVAAGNDGRFAKVNGVAVTNTPAAGDVLTAASSSSAGWQAPAGGGGSGNVVGPSSATSGNIALFDGTTGKLLKDAGVPPPAPAASAPAALGTPAAGSSTSYARADHVHQLPSLATLGAASAAQGALAGTALQPATGMMVVNHGTVASTARPSGAAAVYWIGSVAPTNKAAQDLWLDNS